MISPLNRPRTVVLGAAVVVGLLMLELFGGWAYALVVTAGMLVVGWVLRLAGAISRLFLPQPRPGTDLVVNPTNARRILIAILVLDRRDLMVGLFLSYAVAGLLLLGVAGPVAYNGWIRSRPLRSLGVGLHEWRPTILLALVFAAVQFSLTLWGYDLPQPVDWIPLLLMSLTVGVFESVFFRGFVQNRLEDSFGPVVGIGAAAALYGLYHIGYGMGVDEIFFLTGLGVVYAVAFSTTRNVLVLWPLLTPLGSFFNNLEAGDIELPWASMIGFGQVLLALAAVLWLAQRHVTRSPHRAGEEPAVESIGEPLTSGRGDRVPIRAKTRRY